MTRAHAEEFARLTEYANAFRPGARRFDMGEFPQFVLTAKATAALTQMLAWGVDRIQGSLSMLTRHVERGAVGGGVEPVPARDRVDHMIGLRPRAGVDATLVDSLAAANVYVSVRGDAIRVAPHVYNTTADVDRLLRVLQGLSV